MCINTEFWVDIASLVIPIFVAYLVYLYAIKQMREESVERVKRNQYDARLRAYQSVYKILRYTTDTENEDSIIVWEQTEKKKQYYFRRSSIERFLQELPYEYYECGHGLYLSTDLTSQLFKYRSVVYGLWLASKHMDTEKELFQRPEVALELIRIHHDLTYRLKEVINDIPKL